MNFQYAVNEIKHSNMVRRTESQISSIKDTCYKGTRILIGDQKRDLVNKMIEIVRSEGFVEIQIPIIHPTPTFQSKVGDENRHMMFRFTDNGGRDVCLAPEYTAVVQQLALNRFKYEKNVKLFYVAECFRGETPQAGRYRQFTQFGVEILNPTVDFDLQKLATDLISLVTTDYELNQNVVRGLDYYKDSKGFEIKCEQLGSSKQVCGGGEYEGGVGFAIGVDRLLLLM